MHFRIGTALQRRSFVFADHSREHMNQLNPFGRSFRDEHTRVLRILLSSLSEADLAVAEAQVQRELAARADQERNALRL